MIGVSLFMYEVRMVSGRGIGTKVRIGTKRETEDREGSEKM